MTISKESNTKFSYAQIPSVELVKFRQQVKLVGGLVEVYLEDYGNPHKAYDAYYAIRVYFKECFGVDLSDVKPATRIAPVRELLSKMQRICSYKASTILINELAISLATLEQDRVDLI